MSKAENLQIVRRLFRLRSTGDIDETVSYFAEHAENKPLTTQKVLRGRAAIRSFLEDTAAAGIVLEASTFRFEANDAGQVAVFGRLRVRGREGMKDIPAAWVYTLEDGKVVRAEGYRSVGEAEAVFGKGGNGGSAT